MNRRYPSPILPRHYRPGDSGSSYSGLPLQDSFQDSGYDRMIRDAEEPDQKEKKGTVYATAHQFSQDSSFHGIQYIGDSSVSRCRR